MIHTTDVNRKNVKQKNFKDHWHHPWKILDKYEHCIRHTNSSAISDNEHVCELDLQIGTFRNVWTKLRYVRT